MDVSYVGVCLLICKDYEKSGKSYESFDEIFRECVFYLPLYFAFMTFAKKNQVL